VPCWYNSEQTYKALSFSAMICYAFTNVRKTNYVLKMGEYAAAVKPLLEFYPKYYTGWL